MATGPRSVSFLTCAALMTAWLSQASVADTVLHVDDDARFGGDGQTWETAYRFPQDALTFAAEPGNDVTEIWLAQGMYRPDQDGENPGGTLDRSATFNLLSGVTVLGGFAGVGADDPDERDPVLFTSIFNGDLAGDDDAGNFSDNTRHLVTANSVDETAVIDGVVIERGNSAGDPAHNAGGAILIVNSTATIIDCTLQKSRQSAVLVDDDAAPLLTGCSILSNESSDDGGGALVRGGAVATFSDCYFFDNTADLGGGMCAAFGGLIIAQDCVFENNQGGGGGVCSKGVFVGERCDFLGNQAPNNGSRHGGAIQISESGGLDAEAIVVACRFIDNDAPNRGGAIYNTSGDLVAINCLFDRNEGSDGGGYAGWSSNAVMVNCTFANNRATDEGGGFMRASAGTMTMANCILWANLPDQIADDDFVPSELRFSDIQGGWPGEGNIDADPLFVNMTAGNIHLLPASPCIDAGNNDDVPDDTLHDLDGNERILDGDGDRIATVDLGAYEYVFVDCNDNGVDDGQDIADGSSDDCNGNAIPDDCDLAAGLDADCNENGQLDGCDIAEGFSEDVNGDGVPDECEVDCNRNGIPDFLELLDGSAADCNANQVPDECDIASGFSVDCNSNGVPDECDIPFIFSAESGELSPIGFGFPQSFELLFPPEASSDIVLSFAAFADLSSLTEEIVVDINGVEIDTIFMLGANDCPARPDQAELLIPAETYNAAVAGGNAIITMTPTEDVSAPACGGNSFISVSLEYAVAGESADDNGNGIPDECETLGDLDGDGDVDAADLILLLGAWGLCDDCNNCAADLDGDCDVGGSDLIVLLGNWG